MSDLDLQEEKSRERESKSAKLAGWILFILALIVAAIVLGPCDPPPGEPIPAGAPATTTGAAEGATPQESSSSSGSSTTAGETSTGTTS